MAATACPHRPAGPALGVGVGILLLCAGLPAAAELPPGTLRLPPGFRIELVAKVPHARAMTWGDRGTLFVGSSRGSAYAVTIPSAGAAWVQEVASALSTPIGVAFHAGTLYVSSTRRIVRLPGIEARLADPPTPEALPVELPGESWHGGKFIAFGPDGKLYVPQGMPCNVCERDPDRYGVIARMNVDGSEREVVARGVRNTVGFDWQPGTATLYFTDNGRDHLGDDAPPDELNRIAKEGQHFGFPYCHGGTLPDPEFGTRRRCSEFEPPIQRLGAHVASLGMRFYTGRQFPAEYRGAIFIAEHGSWNRSSKVGYRLSVVALDASGTAVAYRPFAEGFWDGKVVHGRPVDVLVAPDGSLLVSDDHAGAIYRISYRP